MAKKISRPTSFKLGVYNWTIRYLDIESPDFGETFLDTQEIHINVKSATEQNIKNTITHELLHATLEDIMDTVVKMDVSPGVMEESLIRLLTPRLQGLLTNNPKLTRYLFSK